MKITSCKNKWTVNASHKSCIPVFFPLGAWLGWELLSMNHFSLCFTLFCPLPQLWAVLSLHERNNLKWRNTSMSPFPPLLHRWLYNWFFFFPPVVPAIAVITIYLGPLFHYSKPAVKPEEKCCVLWFMEAIWPVLIRGIYECDADFGNRLWALLCDGSLSVALRADGIGVSADWKTNTTHVWKVMLNISSAATFHSTCYCRAVEWWRQSDGHLNCLQNFNFPLHPAVN